MPRRSSIPLLLVLLAGSFAATVGQAKAQCNGAALRIHVQSVEAGEAQPWVDPRLGSDTRGRLRMLFDYTSYRLVRTEEVDTPCGQPVIFELPGGHVLHVRPMAIHGNRIAVDLAMFVGARPVMRNQLKLIMGSMLLLIGSQSPQRAEVTTVSIDTGGEPFPSENLPQNAAASPQPTDQTPSLQIKGNH
jgi:hypothetical protein